MPTLGEVLFCALPEISDLTCLSQSVIFSEMYKELLKVLPAYVCKIVYFDLTETLVPFAAIHPLKAHSYTGNGSKKAGKESFLNHEFFKRFLYKITGYLKK